MNAPIKILVVDDDVQFTESIGELLEAYGYDVRVAHNGAEGLALARELRPDLMILDVMMTTETEGFEVARRIPEAPELKNMGILLVTGLTQSHQLPGGLRPDQTWLPVDRVLEKPIVPDHLILELERVLQERGRRQSPA